MRLFGVSPLSRWTSCIAPRTARQSFPQSKWANAHPVPVAQGARGNLSLPGAQKQRQRVSIVRNWMHERGRYEGKVYPCNIDTSYTKGSRVWLGYVMFTPPPHLNFRGDRVDVSIEMSPPGTRHPRCFALLATPEDPASRLALRVRGDVVGEGVFNEYMHSRGPSVVFRANALTDFLTDTASREEIMRRPRRAWETKVRGPRKKTPRKE